jgi:hypothetical protein
MIFSFFLLLDFPTQHILISHQLLSLSPLFLPVLISLGYYLSFLAFEHFSQFFSDISIKGMRGQVD